MILLLLVISWDAGTRGGETGGRALFAEAKGESDGASKNQPKKIMLEVNIMISIHKTLFHIALRFLPAFRVGRALLFCLLS